MAGFTPVFTTAPTGSADEPEESSWISTLGRGYLNVNKGLLNTPSHFLNSFVSLGEDLSRWATGTKQEWFDVWRPFGSEEIGMAGRITQEAGSFAAGMITGSTILSALGKAGKLGTLGRMASGAYGWGGRLVTNAGVGAAVDFTLADTEGGNLSNLLSGFPILQDSVLTYLRHEEDDSNLEKRLKNAMEGIPLGLASDVLFEGFTRVLRYKRAKIDSIAGGNQEKAAELIGKETGIDLPPVDSDTRVLRGLTEGDNVEQAARMVDDSLVSPETFGDIRSASIVRRYIDMGDTESLSRVFKNVVTNEDTELLAQGVARMSGADSERWTLAAVAEQTNHLSEMLGEKPSKAFQDMMRGDESTLRNLAIRSQLYAVKLDNQGKRLSEMALHILDAQEPNALLLHQFAEDVRDYETTLTMALNIRKGAARTVTAHRNIILDGKAYRGINALTVNDVRRAGEEGKQLYKQLQDALENNGGRNAVIELAKKIKDLGAEATFSHKKAKEIFKTPKMVKVIKALGELRMANILSGVATQGVNVMGNLMNFVLRDGLDQMLAAGFGALRGGTDRVHFSAALAGIGHSADGIRDLWRQFRHNAPTAGKTFADLRERGGLLHALVNFVEQAELVKGLDPATHKLIEGGKRLPQISAKNFGLDETALSGTLVDLMGKTLRAPSFGVMGAMDTVATDTAFHTALARNLKNHALREGMSADVMGQFEKRMRQAVLQFARDGSLDPKMSGEFHGLIGRFYNEALTSARASTFKSELDPHGAAAAYMRWLNRDQALPQVVKMFVTPFVKTPVNIIDSVMARTPYLYSLRREYKAVINGTDQAAKDVLRARVYVGTAMYALGASLYTAGMLTGAHDRNEREGLLAAGIPQYSVRLGGKWYSYNRLDPLGSFLGIMADTASIARYMGRSEWEALPSALIMVGANNVLNKTYMQGLTDLSDLVGDPTRYMKSYGTQQIQAMIPLVGLQRSVNQVISPEQKELREWTDRVASATILRSAYPDKLDMFGEPVAVEKTPLALILGIRTVTEREGDPVRMELAKYSLFPKDNLKRIMGEEITAEENKAYKETLGALGISDGLRRFVTSSAYANMNDTQRIKALKNLIGRYRTAAKNALVARDPNLRGRIIEQRKRILSLLQSSPRGARVLSESWQDIRGYRVDDDGDE